MDATFSVHFQDSHTEKRLCSGDGGQEGCGSGLWSQRANCFALPSQIKEGRINRGEEKPRSESHLQKETCFPLQIKTTPSQSQSQSEPNQTANSNTLSQKSGECGLPVYFPGDLVIQVNVAKPPPSPEEQQHTDESKRGRVAGISWVERNNGNLARWC